MTVRPPAVLPRDMRHTTVYGEVEAFHESVHSPAFGQPGDALDLDPHPHDGRIAMTVEVRTALQGTPTQRVAVLDGDDLTVLTGGEGTQTQPRWSPDGRMLAWLSDHKTEGRHQLQLWRDGEAADGPEVEGTVEYHRWSPDGSRILLGVAGPGADQAGGMGSGTVAEEDATDDPPWLPVVEGPTRTEGWRRAVVVDVADNSARTLSRADLNVWEAVWKGDGHVLAVCSDGDPGEGAWYTADLRTIDVADGADAVTYRPADQIGWPAASVDGTAVAVVEAVCSDRWIVAGELKLVGDDGTATTLDTAGADVTATGWLADGRIAFAGLRRLDTVLGVVDPATGQAREQLSGFFSTGRRYPTGAWRADGTAVVVRHAYDTYPEITEVGQDGSTHVRRSLRHPGADVVDATGGRAGAVTWSAPDGLEVDGILVTPQGPGPHPLVVVVHGGPIWAFTNTWGMFYGLAPLLVTRGFAVLHPNPRGSGGRGQAFARHVVGDMGGADTQDYLSGLDALVERGVVDPDRIVVTGGSYGGFMTSWLITQDDRFAAAAPVAPVTNWYSQHHTSNLQAWDHTFLDRDPRGTGLFHDRSPLFHADRVTTPTLHIAGQRDRCTPPTQAVEFHRALQEVGVETHLVLYPEEGHGVRNYPALIDHHARLLAFFLHHTAPDDPSRPRSPSTP